MILFLYLDLILSYKRRAAQAWIPRWPRSWSPPSSWCSASSPPSSSGSASHSPNLSCPPEIEPQYILDEDSSLPVPGSLLESRSSSPAHPQSVLARLLLPPTIISPGSNLHFHFHFLFHFHFALATHDYFTRFLLPSELTYSILVAGDSYVHVFPGASQIPRVSTVGFQCWRSLWFSLHESSASCPSFSSSLRSPSKPI